MFTVSEEENATSGRRREKYDRPCRNLDPQNVEQLVHMAALYRTAAARKRPLSSWDGRKTVVMMPK